MTVHSKQRPWTMDEVEKLLLILIKEKELDDDLFHLFVFGDT